ncbi:spinster family MFS transporter [Novosphingobium sp. B 225]|uniref:spinster family MFS transporter n=1 Tax=Novosphingobium sp. B 225 TaxID=1961849 RepID=UPI000B4B50AD|nr:MFS transporter [Novosphingobium sp. B 225]
MTEPFPTQDDQRWPWRASWPLAILTLISVFNYLDRSLLGLALPLIKQEFGSSDTVLGLVSGLAFVFLYSLVGLPIAWLADRANRRNIIAVGLAFWSLMTVATGYVSSILQLAAARLLLGAGEAAALPPANSIIADLFPKARRPLALAIFGTANSLAFIVFFPIAGWVAQHHGWRAMFIAMGLPGLILVPLLVLTVREPVRQIANPPRLKGSAMAVLRGIAELFRNRCYVWIFVGVTLMGANVWAAGAWTPTFFTRVHGMGLAQVASIVGPVRGVVSAAGILAGGLLIDRIAPDRLAWRVLIPAFACIAAGPSEALLLLGESRPAWFAGLAAASFFTLIHQGPIYAAITNIVRKDERALAIAMILLGASFLGNAIGPTAVGLLNDALQPELGNEAVRYSMLLIALTPMLAGLCMVVAAMKYEEYALRQSEYKS